MKLLKQGLEKLKTPLYKNSLYMSLSSASVAFTGFLFWNITSRYYPSASVGIASAIISALNLIFMVSLMGLNFSLIRFYPKYKEEAIKTTILIITIVAFLVSITYAFIVGSISDDLKILLDTKVLIAFVTFSIMGSLYHIFGTILIAMRKGREYFVQALIFNSRVVFLFVLVFLGVLGIFISFGLGIILSTVYAWFVIGNTLNLKNNKLINKKYLRVALKFSLANYIANILNIAPQYVMPTVVLSILGDKQAAYYYIAFSIGNMIMLVPGSISTSFFVESSYRESVKGILKKALLATYLYLILAVGFVWLFGNRILQLFSDEYTVGFHLLRFVTLASFFAVIINFYVVVLNIKKKLEPIILVNLLKAIIFIWLSYILMLKFGITGIGYAWLITHMIIVILLIIAEWSTLFNITEKLKITFINLIENWISRKE